MIFKEAYKAMKEGAKIKLPEWKGFWVWEDNTIKMYCKEGKILDIRETEDVDYTLRNIIRDDWVLANDDIKLEDLDIQTLTFGEAIRNIKLGKKVARKGWNGKNQYIELATNISYINIDNEVIAFVGTSEVQLGWLASQADMLATDWIIVK